MSCTSVDLLQAISEVGNPAIERKSANFHDVFGTEGCLLDCPKRKAIQQAYRGTRRQVREAHLMYSKTETLKSFSLVQLLDSASNGCGSCKMFNSIIEAFCAKNLFATDEKNDSRLLYHISIAFVISQESFDSYAGSKRKRAPTEVRLFYPEGNNIFGPRTFL